MTPTSANDEDTRLEEVLDAILRLAAGDLTARTEPSERGDALDAVMTGMNMLAEELAAQLASLKQAQHQLLESERKYHQLVDEIDDGIIVVNQLGELTFANKAWARITGYANPEDVLHKSIFDFLTKKEKLRIAELFKRDMETGVSTELVDTSIVQPDGNIRYVQILPSIIVEQGKGVGGRAVIRDTTERRKAEEEMAFRASHDSLTGLPNRAMILQTLDYLLAQARRNGGFVAALFLDLDEFKLVNDTLGHDVGDELLRQTARRLRGSIRESDFIARLGGDEFLLLLPSHCHQQLDGQDQAEDCISKEASVLAQRIIDTLKPAFQINDQEAYIGVSIGISLYPSDAADSSTLLQHADSAMYHVKETGRNGFHFYSSGLSLRQEKRLRITNELHRAIEQQEFVLLYQPIIDLVEGRMVGVEALIRWHLADGSIVKPADFIPVAEETGLIITIGQWVLEEACRQASAWQQQGFDLSMAVNVSVRQFWHGDILQQILDTIAATGMDKQHLELEITESAIIEDPARLESVLKEFRDHGLSISLDDFGTGYSSLNRLKRLSIHKLKIDRSFVDGIPNEEEDMAIVTAIIQMATSLGLDALAEGVETAEQWHYLREQGCRYGQGYHFSRPVAADEIAVMARQGRRWQLA